MFPTLRQSMAWLHGAVGIALGGLLFAVFFAGTVAVFDREVDAWMSPATRIAPASASKPVSLDALRPTIMRVVGGSPQWSVLLPTERDPRLQLRFRGPKGSSPPTVALDPATGKLVPKSGTLGASGFFLPFHYSLLITWMQVGYWVVGFAAAALSLALVTGVLIHARLVANLFTFRPDGPPRRRLLDLHNLTGVAGLPFAAVMAVSGLLVSYVILMPAGVQATYGAAQGARAKYFFEVFENYRRPPAKRPAAMAPLDPMVAEASRRWGGDESLVVQAYNVGDANAYVEMRRRNGSRITSDPDLVYFDGVTGQVLKATPLKSAIATQRWLTGLHMAGFAGPVLRWLYFALGAAGCVTIATGMLVWLESRRARAVGVGHRLLEALTVASVIGIALATGAYLLTNRLLPEPAPRRATWEMAAFFAAWVASLAHAAGRRFSGGALRSVWREQVTVAAFLAAIIPMADAVSTGGGLLRAFEPGQTAAAGVDAVLLATAVGLASSSLRLGRSRRSRA